MDFRTDVTWHRAILTGLAWRMRPTSYLELGLPHTPTVYDVAQYAKVVYAVDDHNARAPEKPNIQLFTMTTDAFFSKVAPSIEPPELVFIDACHERDQVLRDLAGVASICAENCVVLLHDTFPADPSFLVPELCNNSHECPDRIQWEHVTLPTPPGLTLCRLRPKSLV